MSEIRIKASVRDNVARRDGGRCVYCDGRVRVAARARRASDERFPVSKQPEMLSAADLVSLCATCDGLTGEAGVEFAHACRLGIRVRDFAVLPNVEVPVYLRARSLWVELDRFGLSSALGDVVARERIAMVVPVADLEEAR